MVRSWVLWTLGLCLVTQSLTAKEKAGEWILTIDTPRNWARVANSLSGRAKLIRVLGKSGRYALFQGPNFSEMWGELPSDILSVQPNYAYSTFETLDPEFSQSWAFKNLLAESAWEYSTGSKQVRVAILDSGIDKAHGDLQKNRFQNPLEISENGIDDDSNQWVDDGWGWNFLNLS